MTWMSDVASGLELIAKGLRLREKDQAAAPPAHPVNGTGGERERREYLSPPAAAELLDLAPQTLANLRSTGGGPPYHTVGRKIIYARQDLVDWLRGQRRTSTQEEAPAS